MVEQVLTVGCKLVPTKEQANEMEYTLRAFANACNWINQTALRKIRNNIRIQGIVYLAGVDRAE
jgi:putative transposase